MRRLWHMMHRMLPLPDWLQSPRAEHLSQLLSEKALTDALREARFLHGAHRVDVQSVAADEVSDLPRPASDRPLPPLPPPQELPWVPPLHMAAAIPDNHWALLYSGVQTSYSGRYSYLACDPLRHIEGDHFNALRPMLTADHARWDNAWFGYFGYGLKHALESLPPDQENALRLPPLSMTQYGRIYVFDHAEHRISLYSHRTHPGVAAAELSDAIHLPPVQNLTSNMSKQSYLEKAASLIARIHAGDLYQANLTRKWSGTFSETPRHFDVFRKLCAVSPAPYSVFMQMGDSAIASSSPELFLSIDAVGRVRTRPIKGTSPRRADPAQDAASKQWLADSAKDRAENLMIVDLMRNDLSRSCEPGSVKTDQLFEITSHSAVHHMSSTVTGQKRADCSALDVIAQAFPPGSMTGAPKITAMACCTELEQLERGVYSGAIGWLGGDGSAELSVVIRTIIMHKNRFEFQVGGGITADSIPESEWQETLDKASGIAATLGLCEEQLRQ